MKRVKEIITLMGLAGLAACNTVNLDDSPECKEAIAEALQCIKLKEESFKDDPTSSST